MQNNIWAKAVSQLKNKQNSAAATESTDITDLEIASVLLSLLPCLNHFYYQENLKLINSLKFV